MRLLLSLLLLCALATRLAADGALYTHGDHYKHSAAELDLGGIAELFPNGAPDLLKPSSFAEAYSLPPAIAASANPKLPASVDYSAGPLQWNLKSSVKTQKTAAPPIPAAPTIFDPRAVGGAAGGTGEMRTGLRYKDGPWEIFGSHGIGLTQPDGLAPSVHESTTFGSLFTLPGVKDARIGASVELTPLDQRKTRVEYRQKVGAAEGYIAAEQIFTADPAAQEPPPAFRAGVNRKF
jgi:hypothetical protein